MTYSGHITGMGARWMGWLACALLAVPVAAADSRWLRDTTVQRTAEYVRIDTVNPPGDTAAAVDFLADALVREGISFETVDTGNGRVNLWARLPASSQVRRNPAIMLLHHMDTPPASAGEWSYPPLSGELTEDRIHGRGALANKSLGAMHLQSFIALHRAGIPLQRDVIFLATVGQEDGGEGGLAWLVEHYPEVFNNVGFVLTGGGFGLREDDKTLFHVEVGAKAPLWLRLRARETLGINTAAERLLDGLQRLRGHQFELEVTPPIANYFAALAPHQPEPWRAGFADIATAIKSDTFRAELRTTYPRYYDLLHSSCGIASISVGPGRGMSGQVEARVDCKLPMHQNPRRTVQEIREVFDGLDIEVETLLSYPSGMSSPGTSVYRALASALEESGPNRHAVPAISAQPGNNHFLRERGIEVYGVTPLVVTADELDSLTGHDESVSRADLRSGVLVLYDLLKNLVRVP